MIVASATTGGLNPLRGSGCGLHRPIKLATSILVGQVAENALSPLRADAPPVRFRYTHGELVTSTLETSGEQDVLNVGARFSIEH